MKQKRRVNAMYFTADWCQPCKSFKPVVVEELGSREIEVHFYDADSNTDLIGANNVMSLPTVIFLGWENTFHTDEIARVAGASKKQLDEALKRVQEYLEA